MEHSAEIPFDFKPQTHPSSFTKINYRTCLFTGQFDRSEAPSINAK